MQPYQRIIAGAAVFATHYHKAVNPNWHADLIFCSSAGCDDQLVNTTSSHRLCLWLPAFGRPAITADDTPDNDRQIAVRGIRLVDPVPRAELAELAADIQAIRIWFRTSEAMLVQRLSIRMRSVSAYRGNSASYGSIEETVTRIDGLSCALNEEMGAPADGYVRIECTGLR